MNKKPNYFLRSSSLLLYPKIQQIYHECSRYIQYRDGLPALPEGPFPKNGCFFHQCLCTRYKGFRLKSRFIHEYDASLFLDLLYETVHPSPNIRWHFHSTLALLTTILRVSFCFSCNAVILTPEEIWIIILFFLLFRITFSVEKLAKGSNECGMLYLGFQSLIGNSIMHETLLLPVPLRFF
jgi:hypothetical protein